MLHLIKAKAGEEKLTDWICSRPVSCYFQRLLLPENFNIALLQHNVDVQVTHQQSSTAKLKHWTNKASQSDFLACDNSFDCIQQFLHCTRDKTLFGRSINCFICLAEQSTIHQRTIFWQFSISDLLTCHWQYRKKGTIGDFNLTGVKLTWQLAHFYH